MIGIKLSLINIRFFSSLSSIITPTADQKAKNTKIILTKGISYANIEVKLLVSARSVVAILLIFYTRIPNPRDQISPKLSKPKSSLNFLQRNGHILTIHLHDFIISKISIPNHLRGQNFILHHLNPFLRNFATHAQTNMIIDL